MIANADGRKNKFRKKLASGTRAHSAPTPPGWSHTEQKKRRPKAMKGNRAHLTISRQSLQATRNTNNPRRADKKPQAKTLQH